MEWIVSKAPVSIYAHSIKCRSILGLPRPTPRSAASAATCGEGAGFSFVREDLRKPSADNLTEGSLNVRRRNNGGNAVKVIAASRGNGGARVLAVDVEPEPFVVCPFEIQRSLRLEIESRVDDEERFS